MGLTLLTWSALSNLCSNSETYHTTRAAKPAMLIILLMLTMCTLICFVVQLQGLWLRLQPRHLLCKLIPHLKESNHNTCGLQGLSNVDYM